MAANRPDQMMWREAHLFSSDHRFSHHLRINFGHPDHERV
jgi:hypothetical protein